MKIIYTTAFALLIAILLPACQQELHFPEVKPESRLTIEADGITYNLKVDFQQAQVGDIAQVKLTATSPEYVISLISVSDTHINGVGEYYLECCNNDVFEYLTGSRTHWEGDHIGSSRQTGYVKITRMDEAGYAGTFALSAKDGAGRNANKKDFKGTFEIYY